MIDLSQYTPAIQVKLDKGVYLFSTDSATGKTYLCSLLRKLSHKERVASHTYPDEFRPAELFDPEKRDLIMLDRYDMYAGAGIEEISRFAQTGIVLITRDLHWHIPILSSPCRIHMDKDRLVVW